MRTLGRIINVTAITLATMLLAVAPAQARSTCQSCWLSLECVDDPWGRTDCDPYDGTHRCEEGGDYCAESDDLAAAVRADDIAADGSIATVVSDTSASSSTRVAGQSSVYERTCGGAITRRVYSARQVTAIRDATRQIAV